MNRFKRREVLGGGLALAAATALGPSAIAAGARRPNIVFILADDMGYADVSCNGRSDYQTPHIDGIAAAGVNLRQGYANSAVCSATRCALMTGRYQYRLRVGLEEPLAGTSGRTVGLPPEHPTLASLLRKAGYRTALIGKWHLGELPRFGPLKSGYERYFGYRTGAVDYFNHTNTANKPDLWDGDVLVEREGYLTQILGERAVSAIEEFASGDAPFLISLHFSAPHWPWEGPDDRLQAERLRGGNIRDFDGGTNAIYAAMVKSMDDQVGAVIAALKRKGVYDNTIVIFTSDNGGERFANVWPFSGQKTELLEGGLRVPTLISWPAVLPVKVHSDQVMITMDWAPTLLGAAGVQGDPAYPFDGIDLTAMLANPRVVQPRKLFWRYKANNQRAMRDGQFKYLKIRQNEFLFDVVADPLERANLKGRQPETFARMRGEWMRWNSAMLPELDETFTEGVLSDVQADHIGHDAAIKTADPGK